MNARAINPKRERKILELEALLLLLQQSKSDSDKLAILNALPVVQHYLTPPNPLCTFLHNLTPDAEYVIKSVIAIGQGPIVFNLSTPAFERFHRLAQMLEQLVEMEKFYRYMGGIIGYHLMVLRLMAANAEEKRNVSSKGVRYIRPLGIHLSKNRASGRRAVRWGIENLQNIAMIYPVGGAGDRLNLTDETAAEPLPAACLPFLGLTLLEGLIHDLQAVEYLYFKLFGKEIITPIVIMTSMAKNNHQHILKICETRRWFGRPQESFYFFIQPLVPMINIEGNWSLSAPLTLTLKPCGHGALWKLAEEQGVFQWLASKRRHRCLIRQINNPLAGTDDTLLGLIGIGCHDQKAFGFASCDRLLNSDEGTDVLIQKKEKRGYAYCLTNIEYTNLPQRKIHEFPDKPGSPFSRYPANTNILFAHIPTVRKILRVCPIPGQLINMKSTAPTLDAEGHSVLMPAARLESTMQNIADFIISRFPSRLRSKEHPALLKTFIVYNERSKTISTTKKTYRRGESTLGTPEQAYYDLLSNHYRLLQQCRFELPEWSSIEVYLTQGPACTFLFHPALGPLHAIIAQKIRGGRLSEGAELRLDIAEVDIENLSLEGSLFIEAVSPIATYNTVYALQYGSESRCTLKNVTVHNKGINRQVAHIHWRNEITRQETTRILLHEGAEFHAENVVFEGTHFFEVPAHHRLALHSLPTGGWREELLPIYLPTWRWDYRFDARNAIRLKKIHRNQTRRLFMTSSVAPIPSPPPQTSNDPSKSTPDTGTLQGHTYTKAPPPHCSIIPIFLAKQLASAHHQKVDASFREERKVHYTPEHPPQAGSNEIDNPFPVID